MDLNKTLPSTLLYLILASGAALGQSETPSNEFQLDIKQNVWLTFKASFEQGDWKTFNALHTDDVLRVNKWSMRVGDQYKASNQSSFQRPDRAERVFDLWIAEGQYSDTLAYEVGYYRITYADPKRNTSYGRFHVLLKKIEDAWMIAQDWDTDEINGKPISSEDFDYGTPYTF